MMINNAISEPFISGVIQYILPTLSSSTNCSVYHTHARICCAQERGKAQPSHAVFDSDLSVCLSLDKHSYEENN